MSDEHGEERSTDEGESRMNPSKTVPCPWCKADVGAGCTDQDGSAFKAGIHMARYYAVQEALKPS